MVNKILVLITYASSEGTGEPAGSAFAAHTLKVGKDSDPGFLFQYWEGNQGPFRLAKLA